MFKHLIEAAIRGAMRELEMNPRDLKLHFIVDGEKHVLASIDATTVQDLMSRRGNHRSLRLTMGKVAYQVYL